MRGEARMVDAIKHFRLDNTKFEIKDFFRVCANTNCFFFIPHNAPGFIFAKSLFSISVSETAGFDL